MRKYLQYAFVLSAAAALVGCAGARTSVDEEQEEEVAVVVETDTVGEDEGVATATGLGDVVIAEPVEPVVPAIEEEDPVPEVQEEVDGDLLVQRVIYFEYDSSAVDTDGQAVVEAHARYMQEVPDVRIILEGHADERGTREYNLALAEDRAKAVADLMQALGVDASRIQTVSYGEERPVALGNDDSAWSLNRRVEILYQ